MPKKSTQKITIGCDPELIIFDKKTRVRADAILHRAEIFGCDGHSSTAELRPAAHNDTREVLNNIASLLMWFKETFPEYSLIAGAHVDGEPIGGHIHIGGTLYPELNDRLDKVFYALNILVEPEEQTKKRSSVGSYGQRKEFRRKPWGIEFRTPLSWLLSPYHALAYLGLAKLIVQYRDLDINKIYEEAARKKLKPGTSRTTSDVNKAIMTVFMRDVLEQFSTKAEEYDNTEEIIDIVECVQTVLTKTFDEFKWEENILEYWFQESDTLKIKIQE